MTAAPVHLLGERLMLDPSGALWWPAKRLLAVADLHLEKGSALAARGSLVPPYDSRATLERLIRLVRLYRPERLVLLGDSFHDAKGAARLGQAEREALAALSRLTAITWLAGNHDPGAAEEMGEPPFTFRHVPRGRVGEIAGHLHPKAAVTIRGAWVARACFVADSRRVLLPAFGAYAGGLDVLDPAIRGLFPRGARVFLLGKDRLFSFPLAAAAPLSEPPAKAMSGA